jgi:hypothetical protein
MNIFGSIFLGSALALTTAQAVWAEPVKIERIEVVAEYSSVASGGAAAFWPDLADDMQGRLAQALIAQGAEVDTPGAMKVGVTIEEVSLDGQPTLGGSGEFNRLRGVVKVTSEEGVNNDVFIIDINAGSRAPANLPAGWTVTAPQQGDVYATMMNAFVETAVQRIRQNEA